MSKLGASGILIQREKESQEQVTKGGIIIPATKKQTKVKGIVLSCGPGTKEKPMEVKKGDTVYYESLRSTKVKSEYGEVELIDSSDCLYIEE